MKKFQYNSPVVLSFFLISFAALVFAGCQTTGQQLLFFPSTVHPFATPLPISG